MSDSTRRLASLLDTQAKAINPSSLTIRRGVVTAVTGTTVTVSIGGKATPGVPFYRHVRINNGDTVDVQFDGSSALVVGIVGGLESNVANIRYIRPTFTISNNAAHNLRIDHYLGSNAPQRIMSISAWIKGGSSEARPLTVQFVDGSSVEVAVPSGFSGANGYMSFMYNDNAVSPW